MENFNQHIPEVELGNERNKMLDMYAFYLGAKNQTKNKSPETNAKNIELFRDHIQNFVNTLKQDYSEDVLEGSESYHILLDETVDVTKRIVPDPLFNQVDTFVRNMLGAIAWHN